MSENIFEQTMRQFGEFQQNLVNSATAAVQQFDPQKLPARRVKLFARNTGVAVGVKIMRKDI